MQSTYNSTIACLQDQSHARQTAAGRADQTFFWNQALVKPVMEAGAHRWGAGRAKPGGKLLLWNIVLPLDTVEHCPHLSPWCQDCQSFWRRPQSMVVEADGRELALTLLPTPRRFVMPVMFGFIKQLPDLQLSGVQGNVNASLTLIARRGVQRAGTRHWRRGADAEGEWCGGWEMDGGEWPARGGEYRG